MKARLTMRAALALGLPCAARQVDRAHRFCRAILAQAGHEAGKGNAVTAAALVALYLVAL